MKERVGLRGGWVAALCLFVLSVILVIASALWGVSYDRARASLGNDGTSIGPGDTLRNVWWGVVLGGFPAVGLVILRYRRRNVIGWIFLIIYACIGVVLASETAHSWRVADTVEVRSLVKPSQRPWTGSPVPGWADLLLARLEEPATVVATLAIIAVALLFPDGKLPSRRWVWVPSLWVASVALFLSLEVGRWSSSRVPELAAVGLFGLGSAGACASVFWRYRRAVGAERLQLRCGAFGVAVVVLVAAAGSVVFRSEAVQLPVVTAVGLFPFATGLAILRYRLYGIDAVINRTFVVVLLSLFVLLGYLAGVVALDTLFGRLVRPGVASSMIAATVVAFSVQPVRPLVEAWVARFVYGRRADARTVLSTFSEKLGEPASARPQLNLLARLVGDATGAVNVYIWVQRANHLEPVAVYPAGSATPPTVARRSAGLPEFFGADLAVPILHNGAVLGAVTLRKARGNPISRQDRSVVEDLANQAGSVLRNMELTTELLAHVEQLIQSRRQLLNAQDTARRQLERDLHDGAQNRLLAIKLKIGLAGTLLDQGHLESAQDLMHGLAEDTDQAITTLRDLARGVYPPLLEARGIAAAITADVATLPVPVTINSIGLGRYIQATEATAYFSIMEAVQNAVKHSAASQVTVTLHDDRRSLIFAVDDDGGGFDGSARVGTGLNNITDRLEAAGGSLTISVAPTGGTRIGGSIPLTADERRTAR